MFVTITLRFFFKTISISFTNNWQKIIKLGDEIYEISKMFAFFLDKLRIYRYAMHNIANTCIVFILTDHGFWFLEKYYMDGYNSSVYIYQVYSFKFSYYNAWMKLVSQVN